MVGFKAENSKPHSLIAQYMNIIKLHRSILEKELSVTRVYRSQHQILMYLSKKPDASQKEIAMVHHVSTATIAVSLKKLEKGGYISRIVDQSDNRYNQIRLTEKGKQIVEKSCVIFQRIEDAMFEGFTDEDFSALEQYFFRLSQNLKKLLPEREEST